MRRIAILAAALLAAGSALISTPARAEFVNGTRLAAATLSAGDIPGMVVVSDDFGGSSMPLYQTWFTRVLRASDQEGSGGATVTITVLTPRSSTSAAALQSAASNGALFTGNQRAILLRVSVPLGVGDTDRSASWQQWNTPAGTWDAYFADSFLRGRLIVLVTYAAHSEHADATAIANLAAAEDGKLIDSDLPTELLTASAPPPAAAAAAAVSAPATASAAAAPAAASGPPPSFTSSASNVPATASTGSIASFGVSVQSGSATNALVDVEVYSPAGGKAFQQFFDSQTFAANETKSFTVNWVVPAGAATGNYAVKIGIFTPGFGTLYNWNDSAATINVQ